MKYFRIYLYNLLLIEFNIIVPESLRFKSILDNYQ